MSENKIEEILEAIWTAEEKGLSNIADVKKETKVEISNEILDRLSKDEFVTITNEQIKFTARGRNEAKNIIRRHRLAERLLTDVLKRSAEETEGTACEYEHFLAPEITEGICTLLGHPKFCPHGLKIPPGECCIQARKTVESVVIPLSKLNIGESGKIAYITTQSHPRLHKLLSFGFTPGLTIQLHQKSPTFIIECDKAQLALENDVAEDIFVWKKVKAANL
jgi:DtxR family Mn-dependent transcriptional regulator